MENPPVNEDLRQECLREVIGENSQLKKQNQILKVHCSKYQRDIMELKAENIKLKNERQNIIAFIIQKQLKQSELTINLMSKITRESSVHSGNDENEDILSLTSFATPTRTTNENPENARKRSAFPARRRVLAPDDANVGNEEENTMKSGRPRRKAAPRNLCEMNLVKKLRRTGKNS